MNKIYMVEYYFYGNHDFVGFFTDIEKAEMCCQYMNIKENSSFWSVEEYNLDETDYGAMVKKLEEQEKVNEQKAIETLKQQKMEEIKRIDAEIEVLNKRFDEILNKQRLKT